MRGGVPCKTSASDVSHSAVSNALILNEYNGYAGAILFLADTFCRLDHLFILFNLIAAYFGNLRQQLIFTIVAAVSSCCVIGTTNWLVDRKLKVKGQYVNQSMYEKFVSTKRRKFFSQVERGQIRRGDILKLREGQDIPCDCVILRVNGKNSKDHIFYQQGSVWDDLRHPSLKRSPIKRQKRNNTDLSDVQFCVNLTGTFKWEYNHYGFFSGSIKQTGSQSALDIDKSHILHRGSTILGVRYVTAMAINLGSMAMGSEESAHIAKQGGIRSRLKRFQTLLQRKPSRAANEFQKMLLKMKLAFLICSLAPSALVLFQTYILRDGPAEKFVSKVLGQEIGLLAVLRAYMSMASSYMINLPYLAGSCLDVMRLMHTYFIYNDSDLVPANVKINRPNAIQTLGLIENMISSKSTLIENNSYVAAYKVRNVMYYNNENTSEKQVLSKKENVSDGASLDSIEIHADVIDYLPYYVGKELCPPDRWHVSSDPTVPLTEARQSETKEFERFLKAVVLCHEAIEMPSNLEKFSVEADTIDRKPQSAYQYEEAQLAFAESFGYLFLGKDGNVISIQADGLKERYENLAIQKLYVGGVYITAALMRSAGQTQGESVLYVKGPSRALSGYLNSTQHQKQISQDTEILSIQGIHSVIVCQRILSQSETQTLTQRLNSSSQESSRERINSVEEYLLSYLSNLTYLGLIGFKKGLNIRNALVLEEFIGNGIKLHLVSKDPWQDNKTDYNALHLFGAAKPIHVTGNTDRQVELSLKRCLKAVVDRRMQNSTQNLFQSQNKLQKRKGSATKGQNLKHKQVVLDQDKSVKIIESDELNTVFYLGEALEYILRDPTLGRLFVALCSMSRVAVGSEISVAQQRDLTKLLRRYATRGGQGYTMALIYQNQDRFMIPEADISVGLSNGGVRPELMAKCDIQMDYFYALTYLLFKHGTIMQRRMQVFFDEILWRTTFCFMNQALHFLVGGFSIEMPFSLIFFSAFMSVLSPAQYIIEATLATDYGFQVFHRIIGEYKQNFSNRIRGRNTFEVMASAAIDCFIANIALLALASNRGDHFLGPSGRILSNETSALLQGVVLILCHHFRHRSRCTEVFAYTALNGVFGGVAILFLIDEHFFEGLKMVAYFNAAVAGIFFVWLALNLKWWMAHCWGYLSPTASARSGRNSYQEIEERVILEEYEDVSLQFHKKQFAIYPRLMGDLLLNQRFAVNANLLKLQRSESIDQLIERVNGSAPGVSQQSSSFSAVNDAISLCSLKIKDVNRQGEYQLFAASSIALDRQNQLILTNLAINVSIGCLKMADHFLLRASSTSAGWTGAVSCEFVIVAASLGGLYVNNRISWIPSRWVTYALILTINGAINVYFWLDAENSLVQVKFLYAIAFTHIMGQQAFLVVSLICTLSAAGFLNARILVIQAVGAAENNETEARLQSLLLVYAVSFYVLLWTLYSYSDEVMKKFSYLQDHRVQRELKQLQTIQTRVTPYIGKGTDLAPKKFNAVAESEVSVIYIALENFDKLMQDLQGQKLIEFMDQIHSRLDSLVEQHGLQRIDSWSGYYVACTGLKSGVEVVSRETAAQAALRIIQFASDTKKALCNQSTVSGRTISARITVATHDIVHGVVGEIKQKHTLLGPALEEAVRLQRYCLSEQILADSKTENLLQASPHGFLCTRRTRRERDRLHAHYEIQLRKAGAELGSGATQGTKATQKAARGENGLLGAIRSRGEAEKQSSEVDGIIEKAGQIGEDITYRQHSVSEMPDQSDEEGPNNLGSARVAEAAAGWKVYDLKEEAFIMQSEALNAKYKLVPKPKFFLGVGLCEAEQGFFTYSLQKFSRLEAVHMVCKLLLDVALMESAVRLSATNGSRYGLFTIATALLILTYLIGAFALYQGQLGIGGYTSYVCFSFLLSLLCFVWSGSISQNTLIWDSQNMTLCLYQAVLLLSRACPLRAFGVVQTLVFGAFLIENYFFLAEGKITWLNYVMSSFVELIYTVFLALVALWRETSARRHYNHLRIVQEEIDKTKKHLQRMIPHYALTGMRHGHKVFDNLQTQTIMCVQIGGLEFTKDNEAIKSLTEVHRIFCKFDALCTTIGVQKICSRGVSYYLMGQSCSSSRDSMAQNTLVDEAYKVVQAGLEMQKMLREDKATYPGNQLLQKIFLSIVIHTGNVYGGVFGDESLCYDVYGPHMTALTQMSLDTSPWSFEVTQKTKDLLNLLKPVVERLVFKLSTEARPFLDDGKQGQEVRKCIGRVFTLCLDRSKPLEPLSRDGSLLQDQPSKSGSCSQSEEYSDRLSQRSEESELGVHHQDLDSVSE